MAFDIGKFIANLLLAYFAVDGHATQEQPRYCGANLPRVCGSIPAHEDWCCLNAIVCTTCADRRASSLSCPELLGLVVQLPCVCSAGCSAHGAGSTSRRGSCKQRSQSGRASRQSSRSCGGPQPAVVMLIHWRCTPGLSRLTHQLAHTSKHRQWCAAIGNHSHRMCCSLPASTRVLGVAWLRTTASTTGCECCQTGM